jgi:hypothetical protein
MARILEHLVPSHLDPTKLSVGSDMLRRAVAGSVSATSAGVKTWAERAAEFLASQ